MSHVLKGRDDGAASLLPSPVHKGQLRACKCCPAACCRCCCLTRLRRRITILSAAAAIALFIAAYFNDFWLLPPLASLPLSSIRLRSISFSLVPPVFNAFLSLNISLTNRVGFAVTIESASARMMYLDGAQIAAGSSSPDQYFIATGSMAAPPLPVPAFATDVIIPVDVVAVTAAATPLALSLIVRDCAVLPSGSGLHLRFYITGVARLPLLPPIPVPQFSVDVTAAQPPCVAS